MTRPSIGSGLRWGLPLAVVTTGVVLRDCLVIAAAGVLALCAFYHGMDARAPMDAFRAAIRSALAGIASLFAAAALALATIAAIYGMWQPAHDRYFADAWLLAASVAAYLALVDEGDASARFASWRMVAYAVLAAALFGALSAQNFEWILCALPLATAVLMALAGWRLLREVASGFLEVGPRR